MLLLCSICSELINPVETVHVTKCGHLFHYNCLQQWIKRSSTCPHCRNLVTAESIFRVYLTASSEIPTGGNHTVLKLQMELDQTVFQLNEKTRELQECHKEIEKKNTKLAKTKEALVGLKETINGRDSALVVVRQQMEYLMNKNMQLLQVTEQLESAKSKLLLLEGLQKVLSATVEEVEHMLKDYHDLRTVATFATALKKALQESESNNTNLQKKLRAYRLELATERLKKDDLQSKLMNKQETVASLQSKYESLLKELQIKIKKEDCGRKLNSTPDIIILDETIPDNGNESLDTITKTENADSPYLNVRQSNPAWAAIMQQPSTSKGGLLKPLQEQSSKVAVSLSKAAGSKAAGSTSDKRDRPDTLTIFKEKAPKFVKFVDDDGKSNSEPNPSYDGLGGHSSNSEAFPKKKCLVPKVTDKHRLKRPATSNTQNMAKYVKSLDK